MDVPDISKAGFAALLELAESRFYAWQLKALHPERDSQIRDLQKKDLTNGGRAVYAFRIYRELLEREVRERIGFYAAVAHESRNPEMLSKPRLEEYRQRIMISVRHSLGDLKGKIHRDASAMGDCSESALPNEHRYIQLEAEILQIVNVELRVLEAEGKLAGSREAKGPAQASEGKARPKRGPRTDYETAFRVAEIVGRGEWRSRLEEICDRLDSQAIPCPKTWKKKTIGDWLTADRELRIEAIGHHLRRANEHRETFS